MKLISTFLRITAHNLIQSICSNYFCVCVCFVLFLFFNLCLVPVPCTCLLLLMLSISFPLFLLFFFLSLYFFVHGAKHFGSTLLCVKCYINNTYLIWCWLIEAPIQKKWQWGHRDSNYPVAAHCIIKMILELLFLVK